MSAADPIDPLERLLNLVGLLLETTRPLTFDEIAERMEGYGGDVRDSSKRKFERDKDTLREYGVPIELVDTDVWATEQGYRIRKEAYYLPEISFTPEEIPRRCSSRPRAARRPRAPRPASASSSTAPREAS